MSSRTTSTVQLPIMPVETAINSAAGEVSAAANHLASAALGPRDIRFVKTLRISVTDACNYRCLYCMPEEGMIWLPKEEILTYEEIVQVARAALDHGIRDFKLTGGEPLLRKDLTELVRMLRELPGVGELSLTTNGELLARMAADLRAAGLDRVTVSMDTLDRDKFREITRRGDLDVVMHGMDVAERCGLGPVKINVVVMRDYNRDEVADFAALTLKHPRTIRFIEFMPLGKSMLADGNPQKIGAVSADQFVPFTEIRDRIESRLGPLTPADPDTGSGPARVFRLNTPDRADAIRGGRAENAIRAPGKIGFIHAMSAPFCSTCNRLRLTADGQLRSCLFDGGEIDIRPFLRPALEAAALHRAFIDCVVLKPDAHQNYGTRQMSQIGG